ncbi:MAG TPA: hypothetical protein DDZ88_05570 [Verrucomicrobiales bacterium]|nr:hypothetical protein [Verrucomicrobiales bacterium]
MSERGLHAFGYSSPTRLIIEDDIVEFFIHDHYSLASRLPQGDGPFSLSFESDSSGDQVSVMRGGLLLFSH